MYISWGQSVEKEEEISEQVVLGQVEMSHLTALLVAVTAVGRPAWEANISESAWLSPRREGIQVPQAYVPKTVSLQLVYFD